MITPDRNLSIEVSLADASHGNSSVLLRVSGTPGQVICVSPEQARRLALELVQAVQRADIRLSLQQPREMQIRAIGLENPLQPGRTGHANGRSA
jgi:hypothetical protein